VEPQDQGLKKVGEHKGKGSKDDERESGAICNGNINTSR
jgi:hypothetical protein